MKIILKKKSFLGIKRFVLNSKIMEIKRYEKNNESENKAMSIFFRGSKGFGVINFYPNELEALEKKLSREKVKQKKEESQRKKTIHKKKKK